MSTIKQIVKRNLPQALLSLVRSYKNRHYNNLSTEQIFTKIYESGAWGKAADPDSPFYSGSGSSREDEISGYVKSVGDFLSSFDEKLDAVDLGCGDFFVGSKIRKFCNNYIACDVVPSLIDFNKTRFQHDAVQFKTLNLIEDELPRGDVVFVRQVLQHLTNDQISNFIRRAPSVYKYLIVTEHLPSGSDFKHNVDKLAGPGTRMGHASGIVLTSPPFNFCPKFEKKLCQVDSIDTGILVTTLFAV